MNNKISQEEINKNKFNAKFVKIVKQKNICDLTFLNFKPKNTVKKIDKTHYVKYRKVIRKTYHEEVGEFGEHEICREDEITETDGRIYEYMSKSGERNKRSLRKIFTDLRYLINSNFTQEDSKQELFITLTYKQNMQDEKQLYKNFNNFMKKLQRGYKNQHEFAYIAIMEPQGRGAWHCHLLLKTLNQSTLTIPWCHIMRVWGHGGIYVEKLQTNNLGSYFVAYMSNAELNDDKIKELDIDEKDITEKNGKRFIKGERLKFYPDYMKIYRNSKNVVRPTHIKNNCYNEAVEVAEELFPKLTYQALKEIDTEKKTLKIVKEQRHN